MPGAIGFRIGASLDRCLNNCGWVHSCEECGNGRRQHTQCEPAAGAMDRWDAVARARLRHPAGASSEASEIDIKIFKNKQCSRRVAVRASCPARGGQLRMSSSTSLTQTPSYEGLEQAL